MPAAAVIPAPIAYIKVVAVKKLVVGYLYGRSGPLFEWVLHPFCASFWGRVLHFIVRAQDPEHLL